MPDGTSSSSRRFQYPSLLAATNQPDMRATHQHKPHHRQPAPQPAVGGYPPQQLHATASPQGGPALFMPLHPLLAPHPQQQQQQLSTQPGGRRHHSSGRPAPIGAAPPPARPRPHHQTQSRSKSKRAASGSRPWPEVWPPPFAPMDGTEAERKHSSQRRYPAAGGRQASPPRHASSPHPHPQPLQPLPPLATPSPKPQPSQAGRPPPRRAPCEAAAAPALPAVPHSAAPSKTRAVPSPRSRSRRTEPGPGAVELLLEAAGSPSPPLPAGSGTNTTASLRAPVVVKASGFQRRIGHAILHRETEVLRTLLQLYGELKAREGASGPQHARRPSGLSCDVTLYGKSVVFVDDLTPPAMPVMRDGVLYVPPALSILDTVCDMETGFTLMHLAVLSEDPELVDICLQSGGSSPHRVEDVRGDTPLTLAMRHAPSCVLPLFQQGIRLDAHREVASTRDAARSPAPRAAFTAEEIAQPGSSPRRSLLPRGRSGTAEGQAGQAPSLHHVVDSNPVAVTRTSYLLRHTLLHCAVSADSFSPPWPGRLDFIKMLVEEYGLRATQENALGFTPAMWAKENAAYFSGGKVEARRIIRYLEAAEAQELQREQQDPKRWLLRQAGVRVSPSQPSRGAAAAEEEEPDPVRPPTAPTTVGLVTHSPSPVPHLQPGGKRVGFADVSDPVPERSRTATPSPSPTARAAGPPSPDNGRFAAALTRTLSNSRARAEGSVPRGVSPSVRMALSYVEPSEARAPSLLPPAALRREEDQQRRRAAAAAGGKTAAHNLTSAAALPLLRMSLVSSPAERTRWWLQCPAARLMVLGLLWLLQQLTFATDTSGSVERVWRCELWGTVWNALFSAWGTLTFFMGMCRVGLLLVFGYALGYRLLPWVVGRVVGVRLLRLPIMGAQSVEERNFAQVAFGLLFASYYRPSRRYQMLLRPVGVVAGIYLAAKVYNALLRWCWPAAYAQWATVSPVFTTFGAGNPAWFHSSARLTAWGVASALSLLAIAYAADLMYQQGSLNVYLPHYRYDQFANWIDAAVYPWLTAHPAVGGILLFPARLHVRLPWRSPGDVLLAWCRRSCEKAEVTDTTTTTTSNSNSSSSSSSMATSKGAVSSSSPGMPQSSGSGGSSGLGRLGHRGGQLYVRRDASVASLRLLLFWELLVAAWLLCCAPLFIAAAAVRHNGYVLNDPQQLDAPCVSTGTLVQAWWSAWLASLGLVCAVTACLQEWNWPSHNVHASVSYPGGVLPSTYPHPSLLFFLLLAALGSVDMRMLVENSRVMVRYGSRGAPVGVLLAALPAAVALLVLLAALLSTSLRVMAWMLRREAVAAASGAGRPPGPKSKVLRRAYEVWRLWAMGRHLFSLPVPAVFGVLRYVEPALPAWELLNERPGGPAITDPRLASEIAAAAPPVDGEQAKPPAAGAVLALPLEEAVYRVAVTDLVEQLEASRLLDRIANNWARKERQEGASSSSDTDTDTDTGSKGNGNGLGGDAPMEPNPADGSSLSLAASQLLLTVLRRRQAFAQRRRHLHRARAMIQVASCTSAGGTSTRRHDATEPVAGVDDSVARQRRYENKREAYRRQMQAHHDD